ncbi:hypothetical protein Q9233_015202 [Columba guinea]|nr:hypothetical protein Q9233_015202 [Columba guinea]
MSEHTDQCNFSQRYECLTFRKNKLTYFAVFIWEQVIRFRRLSSSLSSSSVPLSLGSVPCLGMPGEINANEKWIEGEPRRVWHPAESKLVLKLLFPLHVSHKETKECEICDSVCGFVTCVPRLKMIEILVLAHFRLGGVRKEACPVSCTFIDYNSVELSSSQTSKIVLCWLEARLALCQVAMAAYYGRLPRGSKGQTPLREYDDGVNRHPPQPP